MSKKLKKQQIGQASGDRTPVSSSEYARKEENSLGNGSMLTSNSQTGSAEKETDLTASAQLGDALWKIIGRYDTYIGSTNTKAAFLIAFNTFVAGSIVLKWADIQAAFGAHHGAFVFAAVLLLIAVLTAVTSLWFTFWAINPFLKSPKRPGDYHSAIFFGDVSAHEKPDDYLVAVSKLDQTTLCKDLAFQAHTLAAGLTPKFGWLKRAIGVILFVELPSLCLVVLILLSVFVADIIGRFVGS